MKLLKNAVTYFATLAALLSLAVPLMVMVPATVSAQTVSSNNIANNPAEGGTFCYTFSKNLGEGHELSSADANALEQVLSAEGLWPSGTPITSYTDAVASAVVGFQQKYSAQILAPYALSYGTGYVGTATRAELNALYGCSSPTTPAAPTNPTNPTYPTYSKPVAPTVCPAGYVCTPIVQNPTPVCPPGYTCVPITTTTPNPTSPVPSTPVNSSSPTPGFVWTLSDPANPSSVQGQLQAQGETWTEVPGTITTGSYVEDILQGRLNQPEGRGAIGQVTYTGTSGGQQYATVNFGNGWVVNIDFNELSLVTVGGVTSNPTCPTSYVCSNQQPFTVTSPSAGVMWQVGQTYTIAWSGTDVDNPTNLPEQIYLAGGNLPSGPLPIIGTVPVTTQSFSWTIPSSVQPATNYEICIGASVKGGSGGCSNMFTVVSSGASPINPPGGTVTAVNHASNPATAQGLVYVYWPSQGTGYTYTVTASPSFSGGVETTTATGINMGCYGPGNIYCYNGGSPFPTNGPYTFTVTATGPSGQTVNVGTSNPETVSSVSTQSNTTAALSLDASSPNTQTVAVTNTTAGTYLGLPVLVFDVNAQGGPVTLNGLDASFSTSGSGSLGAAYLYEGSTLIASAAITNIPGAVANFGKFASISVPAGSSVPLTIKVDVSNVSGNGFTLAGNINPIAVSLGTDSNGNSIALTGSVQGNPITVVSGGPQISIAGTPVIVKTNINQGTSGTSTFQYTATFNLQVQAVGGPVTFGLPNSSFPAVGATSNYIEIERNGGPGMANAGGPVVTYSPPTSSISNGASSFTVAQNQTVTLPVTVTFSVANPGSDVYGVWLKGVGYSSGSQSNQIYTLSGGQTAVALTPTQGGTMTASASAALQQLLNSFIR